MRKIIILVISVILLAISFVFILKVCLDLENDILPDGEAEFVVDEIKSLNMPETSEKVINTLDELQALVYEHNFNPKHSYLYIRLNADNKHKYTVTNVIKGKNSITCMISRANLPEDDSTEQVDLIKEYIISLGGKLDKDIKVYVQLNEGD